VSRWSATGMTGAQCVGQHLVRCELRNI
jgi:hypothetical protein